MQNVCGHQQFESAILVLFLVFSLFIKVVDKRCCGGTGECSLYFVVRKNVMSLQHCHDVPLVSLELQLRNPNSCSFQRLSTHFQEGNKSRLSRRILGINPSESILTENPMSQNEQEGPIVQHKMAEMKLIFFVKEEPYTKFTFLFRT